MNYYERHLGDYAKDTAHLSIIEHGAYCLLLDRYYGTEQGIPSDQAHRVARARSKEEKQAVDDVLAEFFELVDGVWINRRAEEEIEKFSKKIPAAEIKKENEKERQRKSRERRKLIFETLSSHGINMPWNATTEQLQTELSRVTGAVKTPPVTQPVTRDDTATQAPSTKHQTPDLKPVDQAAAVHLEPNAAALPSSDSITSRAIELTCLLRQRGAALQASNPKVRAWAEQGITDAQVLTALEIGEQRRIEQANPQPVNAGLIDAILADVTKPNARASPQQRTGRQSRIDNYAAEAAAARGEHENEHSVGGTERDITGESVRVA